MIMKNRKTYYLLLLDKSGSMGSVINETVDGFNEQIQLIKSLQEKLEDQEIFVSLVTFNHELSEDLLFKKATELKELSPVNFYKRNEKTSDSDNTIIYFPKGMTALYDAIGVSVKKLKKKIKKEIKNDEATAVVVILTDGHENSSKKYSYKDIRKLIGKLEKSENWTFSYLGATPDAVEIAKSLKIKKHNSMSFVKEDMKGVFTSYNRSVRAYMEKKNKGIKSKRFLEDN
jgi:uncharacterized protein YegL